MNRVSLFSSIRIELSLSPMSFVGYTSQKSSFILARAVVDVRPMSHLPFVTGERGCLRVRR